MVSDEANLIQAPPFKRRGRPRRRLRRLGPGGARLPVQQERGSPASRTARLACRWRSLPPTTPVRAQDEDVPRATSSYPTYHAGERHRDAGHLTAPGSEPRRSRWPSRGRAPPGPVRMPARPASLSHCAHRGMRRAAARGAAVGRTGPRGTSRSVAVAQRKNEKVGGKNPEAPVRRPGMVCRDPDSARPHSFSTRSVARPTVKRSRLDGMRDPSRGRSAVRAGTACTETETAGPDEIPACSTSYTTGTCPTGQSCFEGACVASSSLCSATNATGTCPAGLACYGGGCILERPCPSTCPAAPQPNGTCTNAGETCFMGGCVAGPPTSAAPPTWPAPARPAGLLRRRLHPHALVPPHRRRSRTCNVMVDTAQPVLGFAAGAAAQPATGSVRTPTTTTRRGQSSTCPTPRSPSSPSTACSSATSTATARSTSTRTGATRRSAAPRTSSPR